MLKVFLVRSRNQLLFLIASCFLFVLVIEPWQLYFLNDDFIHIPFNKEAVFLHGGFFRPVANLFLLLDLSLYGKHALGYFCTSLLLHFVCVIIVFFLVKCIERVFFPERKQSYLPLITAFLFLCYPYHAEPIMWVIGRGAIIASIFTFLSLFFYMQANTGFVYRLLSWVFFLFALFTYEIMWNAILLFGLISFYTVKNNKDVISKSLFFFGVMLVTFIAYLWYRFYLLGTVAGNGYQEINQNLTDLKFMSVNLIKLVGRNFTPPIPNSLFAVIFFGVSVVFYIFCIYKSFRKNVFLGFFLLMLCVAIISGVVTAAPLGIDTHYNESERYIYYSSFFYCLFIGLLIVFFISSKYQLPLTAFIGIVFIALLSNLQNNYRKASAISKVTVDMFAKYAGYKRVVMVDLPQKYRGTMVLRINPKPAQEWMVPQAEYDTVLVQTQTENEPVELPFATGEKEWREIARIKNWDEHLAQVPDSLNNMQQLTDKDVLFWYTPEGLYKINMPIALLKK